MNLPAFHPAAKAIVAAILGLIIVGMQAWQTAVSDGPVTPQEWVTIVLAVIVGALVYLQPNKQPEPPVEETLETAPEAA